MTGRAGASPDAAGATRPRAAIGLRVKTARAIAVVVSGPVASPRVLERRELALFDPEVPESRQPYHAALGLSEEAAANVVARAARAVQAVASRAVRELDRGLRRRGLRLAGVGLVVGSDRDPAKLANPHVRAHAAEGRLFRDALFAGARACGATSLVLIERDAWTAAAGLLGRTPEALKREVTRLGVEVGRPWRADEKTATLAAWARLASPAAGR